MPPTKPIRVALYLVVCFVVPLAICHGDEAARIDFNRDIRPILSENCFHCHGPDDGAREAGLRLDDEEAAKESAIVEGKPEESELILRVISEDEDTIMPPPDSERSLSKEQIAMLKSWIESGAKYDLHWAFRIPVPPTPPESQDPRVSNAIDQFVLDRLQRERTTFAPPATRESLIRRVTFDLTGLPPTLKEIDQFLGDDSANAYEFLVDRLLERESFGERMASDWLDVARYSDTYGYQVDRDRFVWPWRDWVVNAFNANMPYDQFVTEQIAGDLLPNATRQQIQATTFNRLHPQKVEGGSVPEEFRTEYVADRTQTFGTAMLGLTFECCRCHNHKYDPLSQKEYYQLSAFFDKIDEAGLYSYFTNSIPTPELPLPNAGQETQLSKQAEAVAAEEQSYHRMLKERTERWGDLTKWSPDDKPLVFAKPIGTLDFEGKANGANVSTQGVDGRAFRLSGDDAVNTKVGNFSRSQPFSVSLWMRTPDRKERAVVFHRSRAWTDAASRGYQLLIEDGKLSWSLIHFWPGNAIRVRSKSDLPVGSWVHVCVTSDGSSRASGLQIFVNGHKAELEMVRDNLTKNITGGGGDNVSVGQRFRDNGFTDGMVDELGVYDVELTELEVIRLSKHEQTLAWLDAKSLPTGEGYRRLIADHLVRRCDEQMDEKRKSLANVRKAFNSTQNSVSTIMVMKEMPQPRQTYLLNRGAYDQRGEKVGPETPSVLPAFPPDQPRNRLGLARWLTSPKHPLTGRVAANRLWQMCFGRGLVRTPEDFGSQGRLPTHPELLDWLAVDLAENGWDIKRALKQIVMSTTYRQSSRHPDASVYTRDPENEWLSRFPSYRLSAEMLRDSALAVSSRLVDKRGGPPVRPYEVEASFKPSKRDRGEGLYRRSLYTYWRRTAPAPMMMALDASKREVCRVQRERTASPLQAFVLLNGPQFVEAARGLAEKLISKHSADDSAILTEAFRMLTARRPSEAEVSVLLKLLKEQAGYFENDETRAAAYLAVGDAKPVGSLDPNRLAAMAVVMATLMNFDESVMKR